MLNKFPVIPNHFILATTAFKEQTDLLEEEDIGAAYKCLKAYRENGEELFGFFNSGNHSGASQPHRHIQFLPVESMRDGMKDPSEWNVLVDSLLQKKGTVNKSHHIGFTNEMIDVPFTYFASEIPHNASPSQFHELYIEMHQQACLASQQYQSSAPNPAASISQPKRESESPISYNLGFTDRAMLLCPRISEGPKIESIKGNSIGPIALNGTILGGTLLVKSEEEWETLQNDPSKLRDILSAISIPSATSHDGRL